MEHWSGGVMEGKLRTNLSKQILQYLNAPSLQFSITPILQCLYTPIPNREDD
jgi:hypothetical protein